jgi:hypothetical protein
MSLSSVISTTTGTAVSPTNTACVLNYEIPTKDAACAVVHSDTSDKVMKQCCLDAAVVTINDGCASYCLAQGQDVGALSKCLYDNGFTGNKAYCNKAQTATATAPIRTTASGSTATGTASTSGTGTATGTSATSSSTTGAAVPVAKVSTGGVGVLARLFCSALFGSMA